MNTAPQNRTWAGTCQLNDDDFDVPAFMKAAEAAGAVAGVYQVEKAPSTGQVHLQFALRFKNPKRMAWLKANVCTKTHWTSCNGSWADQVRYCTKEESRVDDMPNGSWGDAGVVPGTRCDLAAILEMIKSNKDKTVNDIQRLIIEAYPGQYGRNASNIIRMINLHRPLPDRTLPHFRPHQQALADLLEKDPDDRKIIWVYDPVGNTGKTALMRHYQSLGEAASLSGKVADMAYAYQGERIVFFDLSRTSAEHATYLYDFAERLKSGSVFSGKYDSGTKHFKTPHVVFLSNGPYPEGVWSADRKVVLQWSQPLAPIFNAPKD